MLAAGLTTLFFALSGVTGQRVACELGAQWGNLVRLVIACVLLGIVSLICFRDSFHPTVFFWFFISGVVGFGLGDVALFAAYKQIGARLTVLLTLCLAPIFALIVEWLWLGSVPTLGVVLCVGLILVGVYLAIVSKRKENATTNRSKKLSGLIAAIVAGAGQGGGAVISRKAESVASFHNLIVPGISSAFQRVFAGVMIAVVAVVIIRLLDRNQTKIPSLQKHIKVSGWLLGAALFGPAIGVSCFQWALQSLDSSVVLAVVALTPIVMMPITAVTENDRPSTLSVVGAIVAVAGVIVMYLLIPG